MSEEFGDRLRRSVERVPVPDPAPVEHVARRAGRIRVRRYLSSAVAAAVIVGAGVGVPVGLLSSLSGGPSGSPTVVGSAAAGAALPDVAEIVCDGMTTQVLTPQIKPQPDGVHFRVNNTSGLDLSFQVASGGPPWQGEGGGNADQGIHESDISGDFPPGSYGVRCQTRDEDAGGEEGYVPVEIIDQDGVWIPDQLDCESGDGFVTGISDYAPDAHGPTGDPVEIAREAHADAGDEFRQVGYEQSSTSKVAIVRDGRVVGLVEYRPDGFGGWLEDTYTACSPEADSGATGGGSSGSTGTG